MKKLLIALFIVVLCLPVLAASAQGSSVTVTISETDLNSLVRVSSPARQKVSNVKVDVQEGQVVVTATITPRRGAPVNASATLVPSIVKNGSRNRVDWNITSFTINGKSGSGDYTAARNALSTAYRNVIDGKLARTFSVDSVTVGSDQITITGSR